VQGSLIFDKIKMAVGEYARDYGFSLPNPVCIIPRVSSVMAWDRVAYAELKK